MGIVKIILFNMLFIFVTLQLGFTADSRVEHLIYIQNIFKEKSCYKKWKEVLESSSVIMRNRYWGNDLKKFRHLHKRWCDTLYNPKSADEIDVVFLYFMRAKWGGVIEINDNRAWVASINPESALSGAYLIKENGYWKRCGLHSMIEISTEDMDALNKAIEKYYRDKNGLPLTLNDLTPAYIENLPSDPFSPDGGFYKYCPSGKNWKIYSVGIDGKDNLGLIEYNFRDDPIHQGFSFGDIILSGKAGEIDAI